MAQGKKVEGTPVSWMSATSPQTCPKFLDRQHSLPFGNNKFVLCNPSLSSFSTSQCCIVSATPISLIPRCVFTKVQMGWWVYSEVLTCCGALEHAADRSAWLGPHSLPCLVREGPELARPLETGWLAVPCLWSRGAFTGTLSDLSFGLLAWHRWRSSSLLGLENYFNTNSFYFQQVIYLSQPQFPRL